MKVMSCLWILALLLGCSDAGTVLLKDGELSSGCGRSSCQIPVCGISVEGVHGCMGGQTTPVHCGNSKKFQEFKEVCKGGRLSIDWRIEPLRLRFRNDAGDFEECVLQRNFKNADYGCDMA
ncbi:hypothetical protein SELMODRAFT_422499 [Selaginella moellendorffii]|uniref:Wall-associated receptor kinase galacturonan-binding domain-containing protein n=1 Tax=Selaginella moellendorffii TaxID=88036 RepID=D8SIM5_SELML|nr:hypothetical protein SELMODRAFT_422499 [Selaginella moellendorffii]